jgi:hypothetical protein
MLVSLQNGGMAEMNEKKPESLLDAPPATRQ